MSKPEPPPPSRALRIKLMKNGFSPIPLYGKEPPAYGKNNKNGGLKSWQTLEEVTGAQIRMWEKTWRDAVNTGGLTRHAPAVDIDIMHAEAAAMVEDFALGWYGRRGKVCVRIGQAPKRAILLRTDKPFAKLVRKFVAPDGSKHKIEILGDGQQLVYDGIHPDTGQPYVWHGGDPSTVKRSELPDTDGADVERFLDAVSANLIKQFGFRPDGDKKKHARKANGRDETVSAPSKREAAWAETALQNVAAELSGTAEGDRNNKLYRCAFRMGTMIARGWIARDVVELALENAAAACGHTGDDGVKATRATIESGIEGGLECPHEDLDDQDGINDELVRLARLTVLDYELQRKAAAEQLGMRASVLDQVVQVVRAKLGLVEEGEDGKQGHAVTFPEVEPWPEEVDGAALLDDIAAAIRKHIVMAHYMCGFCALWVVHTYVIKHFEISPKLSIRSPVRRCGKTSLLEILAELVFRAWVTGNITKAALFRVIEMWHPTLLIDEVDTFVGEDRELRGILNQSHRYDGYVTRTVSDDHDPRRFGVYGAVALTGIGGLAATLADRSVTADLKRRGPGEKITKFRARHKGHLEPLHELRRRIVRWIADHEERIAEREPKMPDVIVDREGDNWEVLFAIADEAGGDWPQRARKAAMEAHGAETDDDLSLLELLLVDIHTAFAGKAEITSADLVGKLTRMIGHPWREMGKMGKQLTQNKLARMLKVKGLEIIPGMVGPKTKRVSGYRLWQFEDAFARYLPSEGDSNLTPSHQAANTGTSDDSKPHTEADGCEVGKCEKSNNDGLVRGCEVAKGKNGNATPKSGGRRKIKLPGFAGVEIYPPWREQD